MSTVSTNRKNKHISQEWSSIAVLQKVRGGKARTERLQNDNNEQLDCLIPSAKKWEYTGNHEGIKFNKQMSWQPILSVPLLTHIDTQYFQNVLIYGSQWAKRGMWVPTEMWPNGSPITHSKLIIMAWKSSIYPITIEIGGAMIFTCQYKTSPTWVINFKYIHLAPASKRCESQRTIYPCIN